MSQWAEIRHQHLVEGVAKKQIARRLQLDIKTVRCLRLPLKGPLHLVVDSTGLSSVDEGEWAAAKHGQHRRARQRQQQEQTRRPTRGRIGNGAGVVTDRHHATGATGSRRMRYSQRAAPTAPTSGSIPRTTAPPAGTTPR